MKKLLFSAAIAALSFAGANAQTVYNWNLRAGLGATSHLGTALDSSQTHPASYQLQLERRINRGISAYVSAEGGAIGSIFPAASASFANSFKTNFTTFSAGALLTPNNDRILRYESTVVPYFGLGIGATTFLAKGYVAGEPTANAPRSWAFNTAATAGLNIRLTPNWSVYTALTAHMPLDKAFTRNLPSSLTYPVVLNGIFGVSYTFGRSNRENYSPNVFSYIETEAVLPRNSKFEFVPFDREDTKVDTTKLLNDEMTALKAKVSAMEGEMSSLRTKADGSSADATELKRLQDEVTRLNGDLEKAKNQIADLTITQQAAQPAVASDHAPRNMGARDTWPGVNKQNYPNYFAYPPASLDGIFSQLKTVTLDMSGESTVRGENKNQLVNLPDLLARYPNLGVVISANATGAGGANADLTLSKKRAVSAEQFFLRNGATSRQVVFNYYGSEDPSAGNNMVIEFIKLK